MIGITTAMPASAKAELMQGLHNFAAGGHDFRVALIKATPAGTYDQTSTNYSNLTGNSDEVTGTGYTAGGYDIGAGNNVTPQVSGTVAYTTPGANPVWTNATLTTGGALMYNATSGNRAVYVGSFGGTQTVTSGTLTILMPVNNSTTGLLRLT